MDPDAVVKAFVEHYYTTFDSIREGLANLYQELSMLTFEGQNTQGSQSIVAKLTSLPFQKCQHAITAVDCQSRRRQPPTHRRAARPQVQPSLYLSTLQSLSALMCDYCYYYCFCCWMVYIHGVLF
ncbi:Nuclear transport factor 2 like [Actinidia chinensis var. chinensis]|uniref:Nuclear transport factor 2 like n=1 Tax=Actinidia chinensis var. chinensis TaxID=1590841 RepID=A0A2R6REY0_ACTCC|nr:Nuclear transport factor 2 like [Actinidia chinensis var. chinensis]